MIFTYTIQENMQLKTFLYEQQFSKKTISAIKQNGALLVNQQPVTVREMLTVGDKVEVHLPEEVPSDNLIPFDAPLTILYEDAWLLIVAKPAHQNSAPSREHPHHSLVEQALNHMQNHQEKGIPHIVTRLDRHTMGIVIFAKSRHLHHLMTHTDIDKYYECICEGTLTHYDEIEAPIARTQDSIITRSISNDGKYAKTLYWPIKNFKTYTLCRVKLVTGRTHQIRVHFQHIGAPIVGDGLYGNPHSIHATQLLKCVEIKFKHPITKANIHIKNKHPDFHQLLMTL
ncbi:RluA family pseudouridine synthase [Staphylococcus agnetis]|uniref:RluA family pseudouridine synthase n=1 Tax=Staphylococcus agnetis TaxID=985762 RepID=UPI000D1B934E|nr:RluA family pseudouridine synthase [Staphylococcus agnetis]PTH78183.1 RluA family pseudouridine synthase [Staphylococcus agnetis]